MRSWDPVSPKFLVENVDLFRELHTIMAHRLKQAKDNGVRDAARYFGIYAGDAEFRTIELRAATRNPYVALCKVHRIYSLPQILEDLTVQFQSLVHLLQVRACISTTMRKYEDVFQHREHRNDDWIYGNESVELLDETLGSSSIASP